MRVLILLSAWVGVSATSAADLLYDVDFATPPHHVGQRPTVGGGPPPRDTVSAWLSGDPLVVASYPTLPMQPLSFDSLVASFSAK